jgi:hypothetical protein
MIAGDAALAGMLTVSLIDDFTLSRGDSFEIIDISGARSGIFSGLAEGDTVGNFGGLDLTITYAGGDGNDVTLFVPSIPGDFNFDGSVDTADYVVWRKTDGTHGGYETWRANFGTTLGMGSTSAEHSASQSAVPEPAAPSLLSLGIMTGLLLCRLSRPR